MTQAEINISGNGLEHIPEELFKLRHIKVLDMSFNLLSEWDDVPMTLEKLVLSSNRILNITGYVTQMSFLKYLDLSMNVVPTVSPLHRVQTLQYLFVRRNKVPGLSFRCGRSKSSPNSKTFLSSMLKRT